MTVSKVSKFIVLSVCLAATFLLNRRTEAVPILVAEWLAANSGVATELADVTAKINAYNAANNPDLPLLSQTTQTVVQAGNSAFISGGNDKIITWTAPSTFDFYYVMTKWGRGQANFEHALHYVLKGETLTYNPGGNDAPNGLSHVSIWAGNDVKTPDGGATVLLLGASLAGLGLARRRNS